MGGALITGWRRAGAVSAAELILRDPAPGDAALVAARDGASLNGPPAGLGKARTVLLAVKPQAWRSMADEVAPHLARDAVIISIMAGVPTRDLSEAFPGRPIVRVMPTTSAATLKGAASIWTADGQAREVAHRLFEPLGVVADLAEEAQMHAATAASGSAPAYFYAVVEALEAAAVDAGLSAAAARQLARSALIGAAALMEGTGAEASELRQQVTSPGGTTEAALRVLTGEGGLGDLVTRAVRAAAARSRELGS
ncbi:MAG: proC [Caulobacteraceae bacterium]|nr:proC [Caulobacteraceae bacterium]